MNDWLPKLLSWQELYVMLALVGEELHGYSIGAMAENISLGSLQLKDGTLYPLLRRMSAKGLIEQIGKQPTLKTNTERMHYQISQEGTFRLKEEVKRMRLATA